MEEKYPHAHEISDMSVNITANTNLKNGMLLWMGQESSLLSCQQYRIQFYRKWHRSWKL